MLNVIGLYMTPDENAIVLSIDEKTQIQALDRSQPELLMQPELSHLNGHTMGKVNKKSLH